MAFTLVSEDSGSWAWQTIGMENASAAITDTAVV